MRTPLLLVVPALLVACATVPTQTKFMEEHGVKVTSEALRVRLRAEAVPFTGLMEQAADAAAAASSDPAVRRRALVWKINVVPALYRSMFSQRPLVALIDTWALLLQAAGYLESPDGKATFGPGAAEVLATTRELESRIQEIARWAAPERDLVKVRAAVQAWTEKHPVRLTFATRDSIDQFVATSAPSEALGAFAIVGAMNEDIEGMISRMDFLPIMVPRQATWQAELAYVDLIDPRMEVALKRAGEAMDKVDEMIAWLGTTGLEDFANEQRIQIMRAVSTERVQIEALVDRQRGAIQAFVDAERSALLDQVRQERIAAMSDVQKLADHATEEATRDAKEIIDYFLIRLGLVLGALLILALVGTWLVRRRALPASPTPPG